MKRKFVIWLAALALLAPIAGFATFATAQVALRAPQAGGGLTGATAGSASSLPSAEPRTVAKPSPETASLSGMLAAQNDARARLGLPALTWSTDLTAKAEATVKVASAGICNTNSASKVAREKGASVFWAAPIQRLGGLGLAQEISAGYVVSRWREGRDDYNLAAGECRTKGGACEPYSRMVAPKAKAVGCAKATCSSQAQVWACHYSE